MNNEKLKKANQLSTEIRYFKEILLVWSNNNNTRLLKAIRLLNQSDSFSLLIDTRNGKVYLYDDWHEIEGLKELTNIYQQMVKKAIENHIIKLEKEFEEL